MRQADTRKHSMEVYDEWLQKCLHQGQNLTKWEENFLSSLDQQFADGKGISERQAEILERIYAEKTP